MEDLFFKYTKYFSSFLALGKSIQLSPQKTLKSYLGKLHDGSLGEKSHQLNNLKVVIGIIRVMRFLKNLNSV